MRVGMGRLTATCMPKVPLAQWPVLHADVGVVMFEAPRMFYQRERALYVPHPAQLEALAGWMRHCGVRTLAVVMPYAQGTLPLSVAAGFASLSEQVVSSLGFETVVWVRSAEKKVAPRAQNFWLRVRDLMLSTFPLMVPQTQQPLRAIHVAQAVAIALQHAPPGVHVLSHEKIRECLQAKLPNAAPMTATIAAHTTGASWFPPPGSSP
jgi:hypothetical protein